MAKTPTVIYVAGPYTKPDPVENTHRMIRIADALLDLGVVPIVPHLTMFWHLLCPRRYEHWLAYDLQVLARCDAVLRVPGQSSGADSEVQEAARLGRPVIHPRSADVADCVNAVEVWLSDNRAGERNTLITEHDIQRVVSTDDRNENPKDRVGSAKPPLHLIPPAAEIAESLVMALGAKKYGAANWRSTKVKASIYVAAARRHLLQWFDGQDDDPESAVSHIAHARACLGILLDAMATDNLIDDRPPKGAAAELIERFTQDG